VVKSIRWASVSILLGWWGLPYGIPWTAGALMDNLRGGRIQKEETQLLVAKLAWASVGLGEIGEAKAALRDLLRYGPNEEAKRFKDELDESYPTISPAKLSWFRSGFFAIAIAVVIWFVSQDTLFSFTR